MEQGSKSRRRWRIAAGVAVVGVSLTLATWLFLRSPRAEAMEGHVSVTIEPPEDIMAVLRAQFEGSPVPLWFALTCAELESRFNPNAYNPERGAHAAEGEGSYGLFQIFYRAHKQNLARHGIHDPETLKDPAINAQYWFTLCVNLASQQGVSGDDDEIGWAEVRLRLAGIRPANFGGATARSILNRYRPAARRWREFYG